MDDLFPLAIFPPGGLESSVVTTVWVGALVIVFLNLRFGTTLAGLVVPGYLVPLFFVKPVSATVVIFEAVITYGLAYLFANKLLVRMQLSEMFGRDRFFALILMSVLVRVIFDFFILPALGSWVDLYYGGFDYQNHLQSFGLIIVALIANQFWNSGLWRGLQTVGCYILLTYAIIAFLLVPFTNFSIAGLNYMYEDLATSLLSSPKAYIILLTTAFIASRMNLKYGWEFNGILIPALLGLQWYQPEKLIFTFVEAIVILLLGRAIIASPWFRHSNIEGSRLFLWFFTIGFVYKVILGYALIDLYPSAKITDYYGFGYVVSTLLAIKIYQKHIAIQMTRTTIQTSFISIIIASILGFALTFIQPAPPKSLASYYGEAEQISSDSLVDLYNQQKFESFSDSNDILVPTPRQLADFQQRTSWVANNLQDMTMDELVATLLPLQTQGFNFFRVNTDVLAIHLPSVGFYAFRIASENKLTLQATRARNEVGADLFALRLFEEYNAQAVMLDLSSFDITGQNRRFQRQYDSSTNAGYFQTLHRSLSNNNVLQIRGELKTHEQRRLKRLNIDVSPISVLSIKKRLPESLPLNHLTELLPNLELVWTPEPSANLQRDFNAFGFAELYLSRADAQRALARLELLPSQQINQLNTQIEGYLMQWLSTYKQTVARKNSESYQTASVQELLYWDQEIMTPLMLWLQTFQYTGWTDELRDELLRLNYLASGFGYEILQFEQSEQGKQYLVLQEKRGKALTHHWATLFINLNPSSSFFIQVPNPFYENTSFEFGANLFDKANAQFLLLAGSHPWANRDGTSNVTKLGNSQTLFNLIHQVALRENANMMREYGGSTLLPIQIRGYSFQAHRPFPNEEVLISLWQQIALDDGNASNITPLLNHLDDYNLTYRIANGDETTGAYTFSNNQQSAYLAYVPHETFVSLWLNPAVRRSFRTVEPENLVKTQIQALGITSHHKSLTSYLNTVIPSQKTLSGSLQQLMESYAQENNINYLYRAISEYPEYNYQYIQDQASLQDFILITDEQSRWMAVVNLATFNQEVTLFANQQSINTFIKNRAMWLLATPKQTSSKVALGAEQQEASTLKDTATNTQPMGSQQNKLGSTETSQ